MSRHITKVHLRELSLYDDGTYKHADHYVNNTYCGAHCYVRDSIHEYEGSTWKDYTHVVSRLGPRRFFDLPRDAQCGNCRRLYLMAEGRYLPFKHREASEEMIISVEIGLTRLVGLYREDVKDERFFAGRLWATASPDDILVDIQTCIEHVMRDTP